MNIPFIQTIKTDWGEATLHIILQQETLHAQLILEDHLILDEATAWSENESQKIQVNKLKKHIQQLVTRDENTRRRFKLHALRKKNPAYGNAFKPQHQTDELQLEHQNDSKQVLETSEKFVCLSGRLMSKRVMGKAAFAVLQDHSGKIQIYLERDALPEGIYAEFKQMDTGDIIGVKGTLFRTDKGELSIQISHLELVVKSLLSLPDKFHGLQNIEQRYRQRYLDLIVNDEAKRIFRLRSAVIKSIRDFFNERDFLEVETPMMHPIPGGATAKPFVTHHNSLDRELYLRIAPELYLKKLVVGGFERVYEINRNFRNEGVSSRHNPEFTMLEFYQAYATYEDLITLTEALFRKLVAEVNDSLVLAYQGTSLDFSKPFKQWTMQEAILAYNPSLDEKTVSDLTELQNFAQSIKIKINPSWGIGKFQTEIFEATVEDQLMQPTFITAYPAEVSPLARRNDENPDITDRFELFIGGREVANAFSELNDPEDQAARFNEQVAARGSGDDEAMYFDQDYITALEYGMPPCAGEGIGIDRLVMLLANAASIRDVLLFPQMRD